MIITTLFSRGTAFERGQVEVKLMPGIPHLHIVGLPDASMRESGVRLKSALKSAGFLWPRGHQIIVNLRPAHVRKQSAGIDLAVALGVLAATNQLSGALAERLEDAVVYGELGLDGRVFAPDDVDRAMRVRPGDLLLTGAVGTAVRGGRWLELADLRAREVTARERTCDWREHLIRPTLPAIDLAAPAFLALWLAAHLELSVLVAGPQGSGKSTWARALHAVSPAPRRADALVRATLFGDEALTLPWRPLEQPHHTATPLALIGGGRPLRPGVISRAHGGVLIMDEFLEFAPTVLEALREPLEDGFIELARTGVRERLPAGFQLVATSNLCPCGELNPDERTACAYSRTRCRQVCTRLSGPVLDRFDLLVPSHEWLRGEDPRPLAELPALLARLDRFRTGRGPETKETGAGPAGLSHRRRRAIARVARGLADFDESARVDVTHVQRAHSLVVAPMENLRKVFG